MGVFEEICVLDKDFYVFVTSSWVKYIWKLIIKMPFYIFEPFHWLKILTIFSINNLFTGLALFTWWFFSVDLEKIDCQVFTVDMGHVRQSIQEWTK